MDTMMQTKHRAIPVRFLRFNGPRTRGIVLAPKVRHTPKLDEGNNFVLDDDGQPVMVERTWYKRIHARRHKLGLAV